MIWSMNHGGVKDFMNRSNILHIELPPELLLNPSLHPDIKSDIWSLGGMVLEILFEKKLWNDKTLAGRVKEDTHGNTFEVLRKAMEKKMKPCLAESLDGASQKLKFLSECFSYTPSDRPSVTLLLKSFQNFLEETQSSSGRQSSDHMSKIFPSKRAATGMTKAMLDPLVRQQVRLNHVLVN